MGNGRSRCSAPLGPRLTVLTADSSVLGEARAVQAGSVLGLLLTVAC